MNTFPAAQGLAVAIFLLCLATTLAGALLAVVATRLIRGVCGLAMACVGLAGLFYFLRSPLLALMEILIYVGAVCVTIVFAIMLAEPDEPRGDRSSPRAIWLGLAMLIAGAVFIGFWRLGAGTVWPAGAGVVIEGAVKAIGIALLGTWGLAFEVISLVLMVAILGALAVARTGRTKP